MDLSQFRADFPEFADVVAYPNAMLTTWSTVAEKLVNEDAWQDCYSLGVNLLTAHNLVIAKTNQNAAAVGGVPSGLSGQIASKTVGSVTAQYDTQAAAEKDAGMYNTTIYGKQFIHYARLFGAGAIQL
jgi:Protein of unknown function (DUF4054)